MKSVFKNTWRLLDQKERKQFIILILLSIVISIADILSLVALLWIINFYIQPGTDSIAEWLPAWLANKDSIALIALFTCFFSLKNIAAYLLSKAYYDYTGEVSIRLSRNNLLKYHQSPYAEFVNTDSSAFIRRIALQPFEFSQHVLNGIQQIITQYFLIGIAIIAIIIFNAKLFLLLLIILLPPVIAVFYFIKKRVRIVRKHLRDSNERSYQYLLDALKGFVEANIYQRTDFFLKRFIETRRHFSTHFFESVSLQNLPARVIEIFAVLGLFILILIAKASGNDDSSTLITMGAFMAAAYKVIPGIVKVINFTGQVRAYDFSADHIEAREPPALKISKTPVQSIDLKNINFHYNGQAVLNDLSFSLSKGDILGISGLSGRGKTTILNLLLGFLQTSEGEVVINGEKRNAVELKQFWPSIAYVRQQTFFIYDTLLRNITLEENGYDKRRLDHAMRISGLDKMLNSFPEGLDKIITENGKNISGGQQQRIAIARALYKSSDLLLLDEPFNELDEESTLFLLEGFRELAENKIIILITHDKKSFSYCNKTILLDEQG